MPATLPELQTQTATVADTSRPHIVLLARSFFNDPTFRQGTARRVRVAVGKVASALDGSEISISAGWQGSDIDATRLEEIEQESEKEAGDDDASLLSRIRLAGAADTIVCVEETWNAHRSFVNDALIPYSLQLSRHSMEYANVRVAPVGLLARSAVNVFANIGLDVIDHWKMALMGKTEHPYSPSFAEEHTIMRLQYAGRTKLGMRQDPEYSSIIRQVIRGAITAEEGHEAMQERSDELLKQGISVGLASFFIEDMFTKKYRSGTSWGFVGEDNFLKLIEIGNKEEQHKGLRYCGFDRKTLQLVDTLEQKDWPVYQLESPPKHKYMQDPWSRRLEQFLETNNFEALSAREKKLVLLCYDIGYQNAFERKYPHIRELRGEASPTRYADAKACDRQIAECDYLVYSLLQNRKLSDTAGFDFPRFTVDRLQLLEKIISL